MSDSDSSSDYDGSVTLEPESDCDSLDDAPSLPSVEVWRAAQTSLDKEEANEEPNDAGCATVDQEAAPSREWERPVAGAQPLQDCTPEAVVEKLVERARRCGEPEAVVRQFEDLLRTFRRYLSFYKTEFTRDGAKGTPSDKEEQLSAEEVGWRIEFGRAHARFSAMWKETMRKAQNIDESFKPGTFPSTWGANPLITPFWDLYVYPPSLSALEGDGWKSTTNPTIKLHRETGVHRLAEHGITDLYDRHPCSCHSSSPADPSFPTLRYDFEHWAGCPLERFLNEQTFKIVRYRLQLPVITSVHGRSTMGVLDREWKKGSGLLGPTPTKVGQDFPAPVEAVQHGSPRVISSEIYMRKGLLKGINHDSNVLYDTAGSLTTFKYCIEHDDHNTYRQQLAGYSVTLANAFALQNRSRFAGNERAVPIWVELSRLRDKQTLSAKHYSIEEIRDRVSTMNAELIARYIEEYPSRVAVGDIDPAYLLNESLVERACAVTTARNLERNKAIRPFTTNNPQVGLCSSDGRLLVGDFFSQSAAENAALRPFVTKNPKVGLLTADARLLVGNIWDKNSFAKVLDYRPFTTFNPNVGLMTSDGRILAGVPGQHTAFTESISEPDLASLRALFSSGFTIKIIDQATKKAMHVDFPATWDPEGKQKHRKCLVNSDVVASTDKMLKIKVDPSSLAVSYQVQSASGVWNSVSSEDLWGVKTSKAVFGSTYVSTFLAVFASVFEEGQLGGTLTGEGRAALEAMKASTFLRRSLPPRVAAARRETGALEWRITDLLLDQKINLTHSISRPGAPAKLAAQINKRPYITSYAFLDTSVSQSVDLFINNISLDPTLPLIRYTDGNGDLQSFSDRSKNRIDDAEVIKIGVAIVGVSEMEGLTGCRIVRKKGWGDAEEAGIEGIDPVDGNGESNENGPARRVITLPVDEVNLKDVTPTLEMAAAGFEGVRATKAELGQVAVTLGLAKKALDSSGLGGKPELVDTIMELALAKLREIDEENTASDS